MVLPLLVPSIIAGSIFTFSLTLGDFYVNRLLGGTTQFIGNNIYSNFGVNLPLAAAYAERADPDHGRLPDAGPGRRRPRGAVGVFISRPTRIALRVFMCLVLVVLYFPLLYVARLSVATSKGFAWPPSGCTLDHWSDARHAQGAPRRAA